METVNTVIWSKLSWFCFVFHRPWLYQKPLGLSGRESHQWGLPIIRGRGLFSSLKKTGPLETAQQLDAYLGCPGDTVEVLKSFPVVCQLSLKLNTALPASAACERLFSVAGLIFRPRRACFGSKNFENQLLLRLNKAYWWLFVECSVLKKTVNTDTRVWRKLISCKWVQANEFKETLAKVDKYFLWQVVYQRYTCLNTSFLK